MQREADDTNFDEISQKDIEQMEEQRIESLKEYNIDERDVLEKATQNLNSWNTHFNDNITEGKADLQFVMNEQWSAVELAEAVRLRKPLMTFNKIYDPVKKILGEQRKNKPDLIVRSLTGKSTQEELDLRADLVRTISYQSQNDLIYQTAFKSALTFGYGAFQVGLGYETERSFNKTITYGIIEDPTLCAWDPKATLPHKGDGDFCSRTHTMSRHQFFATYPYIHDPVSFTDPYMLLDFQYDTKNTICMNEAFVKEWYPLTIILLSNGMVVTEEEWKESKKIYHKQLDLVEGSIVQKIIQNGIPHEVAKRQTQDYRLMHYRMLKDCIIEFEQWPGKQLPIPFVDGDSYFMDGKQKTRSFIHQAKDAQRALNYFNSEIVAEVKNRRREQWLGTPENITGYEQIWRNPEVQIGMLPARPDPKTGAMPAKQQPWDLSPVMMTNAQKSGQDIRELLGFSEQEVIGSRDMSGVARRERKLEGGLSTYVYYDNLNQAIAQGGRIVNELLPYIVGEDERYLTVSRPNGKTSAVIFNHKQKDGSVKNVLSAGEFDVEINAGPSFAVQKEQALEFLGQLLQVLPPAAPLVADLWAKNLDVEFMPQMVERLRTLVPPEILAKEDGLPPPPPQPNPQQMMAQQEMAMKQAELKNKQSEIAQRGQQIQIDQERLKNEAMEMLAKMQNEQDKHALEKSKLIADIFGTAQGAHDKAEEHAIMMHKVNLANQTSEK